MARRIIGRIVIDGTDDEIGRDEHIHREYHRERVLDTRNPSSDIEIPDVKWGGECRVEVNIVASLASGGEIDLQATGRLYEGITPETEDLEDVKTIEFTVPRGGRPVHRSIYLRNPEDWGGDHATIRLSFTNSLVEE